MVVSKAWILPFVPKWSLTNAGLGHPASQPVGPQHLERSLPAPGVVALEVVLDRRDLVLDRAPQRPADIGHEGEQVHPRELPAVELAEVGLAQRTAQVLRSEEHTSELQSHSDLVCR